MPYSQGFTIAGLQTLTINIPVAGVFLLQGTISLPTPTDGGGQSAVVSTIKQNGTTVQTSIPGAQGFAVTLECSEGDVLTVALTSANAVDAVPNAVKAVVSVG